MTSDRFTGAILAVAMLTAFFVVGRQAWTVASGPLPASAGKEAPGFLAPVLAGGETTLAEYAGQVVLLDFWATWCPPCVRSMPGLQRIHDEYKGKGLVVLGVNQEPNDLPLVRSFVRKAGLTFPIVIDPGTIAQSYSVYSFPTTVLIDRDGVVRKVFRGPIPEEALKATVASLVGRAGDSS